MSLPTTALFRDDFYLSTNEAVVTAVHEDGGIELDQTCFYATSGGQPGDTGFLERADGSRIALGPFDIEFVPVAHSIPESNALAIRTPVGLVVHTGDWKIDPTPQVGLPTDEARLRELGEEGVLALVCDSTNVMRF